MCKNGAKQLNFGILLEAYRGIALKFNNLYGNTEIR